MAMAATEKASLLRHKEGGSVACMRDVTQCMAPHDDPVRAQKIQHTKQRVCRGIDDDFWLWHGLCPVHAVGVAAVTDAIARWRIFSFKIGALLCRDP
jgi:hypothetical protein